MCLFLCVIEKAVESAENVNKEDFKMKVKALDTYKKLNVRDNELGRIPEVGEEFEVTEERFKILNGDNKYKEIFVEEVKEIIEIDKKEMKDKKTVLKTPKTGK